MPEPTEREVPARRLVLGFDGGCSACGELARRIDGRLAGKLEVRNLREPRVEEWHREALGQDVPLAPTLFEITSEGDQKEEVRAWTGWRLGANLGRFLGPADTWRVMQALGEVSEAKGSPASSVATTADRLGLTRGQFLKGVGGTAVAMSVLSSTGRLASPALAAQSDGALTRSRDDAVGASISHPAKWTFKREPFTFDDTRGFTLWKPESDASHDHGGEPAVRVALAYGLEPGQIEATVQSKLDAYADIPATRKEVRVGRRGLKGVAVGPIPGSTPSTEVYVAVEGRVYQIIVYGETLDAAGKKLLLELDFRRPSPSARSAELPDANAPETLYATDDPQLVEQEQSAKAAARAQEEASELSTQAYTEEVQLSEGCWRPASGFFFQTQHGKYANKRWGGAYTGWTIVGRPNYWGQYTHGNYGYGRCVSKIYTNDMYAVDYPLGSGDVVFSPFAGGKVTFAGRNNTHKNYGIFVVIQADNGKYVSMSAHLSSLASGIYRGARVTDQTVIGYAGKTGDPSIPVGETHLHQAYYRYPSFNPDGSPYGGAGLKVVYHHYVGTAAGTRPGVYKFGKRSTDRTVSKGDWISN
jgi:murein DD-endopeptidase MepM/ murein hydrolase activator NlpD